VVPLPALGPLQLAAICLVLAAVTAVIPAAPSYDPWSWIVWGREVIAAVILRARLLKGEPLDPPRTVLAGASDRRVIARTGYWEIEVACSD